MLESGKVLGEGSQKVLFLVGSIEEFAATKLKSSQA